MTACQDTAAHLMPTSVISFGPWKNVLAEHATDLALKPPPSSIQKRAEIINFISPVPES